MARRRLVERDSLLESRLKRGRLPGQPATTEESQQALDKLIAAFGHRAAYEIGRVYAWDGDKKRSFEWLQRSVAQHEEIQIIKVDLLLRNLRQDPRYTALLTQVNLPVD